MICLNLPYKGFPSDSSILGITCFYNNADLDYRKDLLNWFIQYLSDKTIYNKIVILSGLHTKNPNGDLFFFENYGFRTVQKVGELPISKRNVDSVYLLEYTLR